MPRWNRGDIVEIGDNDGKIALYLNESGAWDLASCFKFDDRFREELEQAILRAYPEEECLED